MTEPNVDIIGEVGRLLEDVQPSPFFAAGIRARVKSGNRKRAAWFGGRNVLLTGMTVCVCAAAVAMLTRRPVVPLATVRATDVRPATSVVGRPADSAELRRERADQVRAAARISRVDVGAQVEVEDELPVVARLGDHEVIVPADQRNALAGLLAGVRVGRTAGPAGLMPVYDRDGVILPPPAVVVAPLPALAPDDPNDDGRAGRTAGSPDDRIRKDKR